MVSFAFSGGSFHVMVNSSLRVEKNTDGVPGAAGGAGNIHSGCVRNERSLKFGTNILGNISSSDQPGYSVGTYTCT